MFKYVGEGTYKKIGKNEGVNSDLKYLCVTNNISIFKYENMYNFKQMKNGNLHLKDNIFKIYGNFLEKEEKEKSIRYINLTKREKSNNYIIIEKKEKLNNQINTEKKKEKSNNQVNIEKYKKKGPDIIKNNKIEKIGKKLGVMSYANESRQSYYSRIIYSDMAYIIRYELVAHKKLKYKNIRESIKKSLKEYFELEPCLETYFYKDIRAEDLIIYRLIKMKEILYKNLDSRVLLPEYNICRINSYTSAVRGIAQNQKRTSLGLIEVIESVINGKDKNKIFWFYGINMKSAREILKEYVKNVKFYEDRSNINKIIFNRHISTKFLEAFKTGYILKEGELSLYRDKNGRYGLIKMLNNKRYIKELDEYISKEDKVYRIALGLKAKASPKCAKIKYLDEHTLLLTLECNLPRNEESLLMCFGWGKENINDVHNIVFDIRVRSLILCILESLNIQVDEPKKPKKQKNQESLNIGIGKFMCNIKLR